MNWTELIITAPRGAAAAAEAVATAFADGGLYIEDYADLEAQVYAIAHVDLIEEELLRRPRDVVRIHLYLSPQENAAAAAEALRGRLLAAGVTAGLESASLRQEDWENSWKQYYHAFTVGARLAVAPCWEAEDYRNEEGRRLLKLDPGMAFGTGTHETTLLCLEALDEAVRGGEKVLDVGCGSGILGIAALLLGAESALGIDIDPLAVRVAGENAALNGVAGRYAALAGDLAAKARGRYNIITANIVADAILRLAPDILPRLAPGGLFVASGIITEREREVAEGLAAAGLPAQDIRRKSGWAAILARAEGEA